MVRVARLPTLPSSNSEQRSKKEYVHLQQDFNGSSSSSVSDYSGQDEDDGPDTDGNEEKSCVFPDSATAVQALCNDGDASLAHAETPTATPSNHAQQQRVPQRRHDASESDDTSDEDGVSFHSAFQDFDADDVPKEDDGLETYESCIASHLESRGLSASDKVSIAPAIGKA
jgi:hypothetical protein